MPGFVQSMQSRDSPSTSTNTTDVASDSDNNEDETKSCRKKGCCY